MQVEKFLSPQLIQSLIDSDCDDVFSILGIHKYTKETFIVRAFIPGAQSIQAIDKKSGDVLCDMQCLHNDGVYAGLIKSKRSVNYFLRIHYAELNVDEEDPYCFQSCLSQQDLWLFNQGNNEKLYNCLGAHHRTINGVDGIVFSVWAPNARRVSVIGDFNLWDGRRHMMRKHPANGVWEIFIPKLGTGELYKYEIRAANGDLLPHKADPFGFAAQKPPEQASLVWTDDDYQWQDSEWLANRQKGAQRDQAISIYEVHLGSWRRVPEEGDRYLTYREMAEQLVSHVKSLGFTHIQLMPVSEFPFDGSWGYQPVGLFAVTSRFGTPDDFKYFVDQCHQQGIGVLVDWVPGHFPADGHGLGQFDGSALYEHADPRQGFHPDWSTYIYNYGRSEVANFLLSNALFWFDRFHIDGLRVDAVASMLYLDYSREQGEWQPNAHGGRENLEAIDLIRRINEVVYKHYPDVMMIAEESTAWPGVSQPTYLGGLGFGYKWNMGWMNDTLRYMSNDPVHRQYHHHDLTFSLLYAFSENFVLPLSHDEVVHGKGSLLDRMPGDGWQKFANLRAYFAYMWTHPGKKLLFMGGEFAQGREWQHDASLDWHQLELPQHAAIQTLIMDLNNLYRELTALHELDADADGFEWIEADDRHQSIFVYARKSQNQKTMAVIAVNMTPVLRQSYRIGLPCGGHYVERLNTDSERYGGSNQGNSGGVHAQSQTWHGRSWSAEVVLPPLGAVVFELER